MSMLGPSSVYAQHLYGVNGSGKGSRRLSSNTNVARLAAITRVHMRTLTELAINRFKWTGFPDSVDVRFVETTLFYRALVVLWEEKDVIGKLVAMQGGASGQVNYVDNPTQFVVTGSDILSRTLDAEDCVPIWGNYLRMPDVDIVMLYAGRLAELDLTIEINAQNARRNKIIAASENSRLSATNITRQLQSGEPVIYVNETMGDMITALDLGVNPDSIVNLSILRSRIYNECLSLLGINNSNQDKKERLVSDEVGANDDFVNNMRSVSLNARRMAVDQARKKFNLPKLRVDYQSDLEIEEMEEKRKEEEDTDNGDIHADS